MTIQPPSNQGPAGLVSIKTLEVKQVVDLEEPAIIIWYDPAIPVKEGEDPFKEEIDPFAEFTMLEHKV